MTDRWSGVGEVAFTVMGEPVHLVVRGPYRHVRNPMISGLLCILPGDAAVTASGWLLGWFAIFLTFRAVAIRFWEEHHLIGRLGDAYLRYRRNVPRWIPRITSWEGSNEPFTVGHHGGDV